MATFVFEKIARNKFHESLYWKMISRDFLQKYEFLMLLHNFITPFRSWHNIIANMSKMWCGAKVLENLNISILGYDEVVILLSRWATSWSFKIVTFWATKQQEFSNWKRPKWMDFNDNMFSMNSCISFPIVITSFSNTTY